MASCRNLLLRYTSFHNVILSESELKLRHVVRASTSWSFLLQYCIPFLRPCICLQSSMDRAWRTIPPSFHSCPAGQHVLRASLLQVSPDVSHVPELDSGSDRPYHPFCVEPSMLGINEIQSSKVLQHAIAKSNIISRHTTKQFDLFIFELCRFL